MRPLPLILFGSMLGGTLGWYSGGTDRMQAGTSAPGAARMETVAPVVSPCVAKLNASEVKARIDAMVASTAIDSAELQLLMSRWVAVDLAGAKTWMHAHYDNEDAGREAGERPLACFFKAWGAIDPASAMDEAKGIKFGRGFAAPRAVVASLIHADVPAITAVLQKLKPDSSGGYDNLGLGDLLRQLTGRDPEAAKALALQLKGSLASAAVAGVAAVWARTDPQAALAWVEQNGQIDRKGASAAVLTEWARHDPEAAGPFLMKKEPGMPDRYCMEAAAEALARVAAESPAKAMEYAAKFIPPDQLKSGLNTLYFRLLVNNGEGPQPAALLCQLTGMLPAESLKDASLFKGGWPASVIIHGSWEGVLKEPPGPARTFLLGQLGQPLMNEDPGNFIASVMKWPDESVRDEVLEKAFYLGRGFSSQGSGDWRAEVRSLTETVDSLPEKLRPLGALKLAWRAEADDAQTASAVVTKYPSIANDENLVSTLAKKFVAQSDPAAAQAWAAALPTETSRALAIGGIASAWYAQDSEAASRWVDALPPGRARDAAAASLAFEVTYTDPASAFVWAASVQDSARQADSVKNVVQRWARSDWQSAAAAVEQSQIPAEQKAALQNEILLWR